MITQDERELIENFVNELMSDIESLFNVSLDHKHEQFDSLMNELDGTAQAEREAVAECIKSFSEVKATRERLNKLKEKFPQYFE